MSALDLDGEIFAACAGELAKRPFNYRAHAVMRVDDCISDRELAICPAVLAALSRNAGFAPPLGLGRLWMVATASIAQLCRPLGLALLGLASGEELGGIGGMSGGRAERKDGCCSELLQLTRQLPGAAIGFEQMLLERVGLVERHGDVGPKISAHAAT